MLLWCGLSLYLPVTLMLMVAARGTFDKGCVSQSRSFAALSVRRSRRLQALCCPACATSFSISVRRLGVARRTERSVRARPWSLQPGRAQRCSSYLTSDMIGTRVVRTPSIGAATASRFQCFALAWTKPLGSALGKSLGFAFFAAVDLEFGSNGRSDDPEQKQSAI